MAREPHHLHRLLAFLDPLLRRPSLVVEAHHRPARWCARALEKGPVHFIASEAHDTRHRPPRLDHAKVYLEKRFGEDYAELLLEVHPRAVIAGLPLATGPVIPALRRKKKWFYFKT